MTHPQSRAVPDDFARFAAIVNYPVNYFLYPDFQLSKDFAIHQEVKKLASQMEIPIEMVRQLHTDEQRLEYPKNHLI